LKIPHSFEVNFDGLVGPTHHYAGLGQGNVASQKNRALPSNPRLAALQGLEKIRTLASLGIPQAIIPPLLKPDLPWLRSLGFSGNDNSMIVQVAKENQNLLSASYSASSMWTANAATVSPSTDSADHKVHITPANLFSQMHRSMETQHTTALLKQIFSGSCFIHHDSLPSGKDWSDEGEANHIRLAHLHGSNGLQIFVYGFSNQDKIKPVETQLQPRQSLEASQSIARLHQLNPKYVLYLKQNPDSIQAGVFHNDVISVGNGPVFFCHEKAFVNQVAALKKIQQSFRKLGNGEVNIIEVKESTIPITTAIETYLFNSQLIQLPSGGNLLLAAKECEKNSQTREYLNSLKQKNQGIGDVIYLDLRQSMRNGGGPACLRLRVVLTQKEWSQVHVGVKFSESLYQKLKRHIQKNYRDRLVISDLKDPDFTVECFKTHFELLKILQLNPF